MTKQTTYTLSELIGLMVKNEEGKKLGRIFDINAKQKNSSTLSIEGIECGERGLLQRIGLTRSHPKIIPWKDIKHISLRQVLVKKHYKK